MSTIFSFYYIPDDMEDCGHGSCMLNYAYTEGDHIYVNEDLAEPFEVLTMLKNGEWSAEWDTFFNELFKDANIMFIEIAPGQPIAYFTRAQIVRMKKNSKTSQNVASVGSGDGTAKPLSQREVA